MKVKQKDLWKLIKDMDKEQRKINIKINKWDHVGNSLRTIEQYNKIKIPFKIESKLDKRYRKQYKG